MDIWLGLVMFRVCVRVRSLFTVLCSVLDHWIIAHQMVKPIEK